MVKDIRFFSIKYYQLVIMMSQVTCEQEKQHRTEVDQMRYFCCYYEPRLPVFESQSPDLHLNLKDQLQAENQGGKAKITISTDRLILSNFLGCLQTSQLTVKMYCHGHRTETRRQFTPSLPRAA